MRRSNPESLRGEILDCFAALAMTAKCRRRSDRSRRVGKAKRAHHGRCDRRRMVGTALMRLCPPYETCARNDGGRGGGARYSAARIVPSTSPNPTR
ncbi:hypothetical protein CWO91_32855 [Bradyrhizobium genosp. SA-3]|nr:hypothetical protein CWO91_32855 [Bradyrhizobium genosp. SA-3]